MSGTVQASVVVERTYRATQEELWALWTTKDGFESWWGPQQFRVEVHTLEPREGGRLHYDMVAATPAAIKAMQDMGAPVRQPCRGHYSAFRPHDHLTLTQVIDFLPGVPPYDSIMSVDFYPVGEDRVRMVVTLSPMHDAATTDMQKQGFISQLTKLDARFSA